MPWSSHHRHWRYKNLTLLFVGLIAAYILQQQAWFHEAIAYVSGLDGVGAVIGGMLFVSTFTIGIGGVILFDLAKTTPLVELALLGGLGEVIVDVIIFHFVRDDIVSEVKPIYKKLGGGHLTKILHTRYFSWTLPVIGALIIASPLPDELGVSLLGLSKFSMWQFIALSYILDAVGIFLMVGASRIFF